MVEKKIDYSDFYDFQKSLAVMQGLWPVFDGKYFRAYLKTFICFSFEYMFIFSLLMYMYVNLSDKTALVDSSYFILTEVSCVVKATMFIIKRKIFISILLQLDSDIFKCEQKLVEKYFKSNNVFVKVYATLSFMCLIAYSTFPLLDQDENNIIPFQGWFPFDIKHNTFNRVMVYLYQMIFLFISIAQNVCIDSIMTTLLNIASLQLDSLKHNLENSLKTAEENSEDVSIFEVIEKENNSLNIIDLISKEDDDKLHRALEQCVEHHKAIKKFLLDVEDVYGFGLLIQFVSSGIVICITGLQLILIPLTSLKFFTIMSYFSAMIMQISAFCWYGNDVILQSLDIPENCYKINWYRTSAKVRRTLFIIMEKSKIPMEIKAGKFFILSISTLTTIFRTAYSYFAVLRQFYKD